MSTVIKTLKTESYLFDEEKNEIIYGPCHKMVQDGNLIRVCIREIFHEGTDVEETKYSWGLIDFKGKEILEPKYHFIEKFINGFARVKLGGFFGLIDESGKYVIEPTYHDLGKMGEMGMYARAGSRYGVINIVDGKKEVVKPFKYKHMRVDNNGGVTLFNDDIGEDDAIHLN